MEFPFSLFFSLKFKTLFHFLLDFFPRNIFIFFTVYPSQVIGYTLAIWSLGWQKTLSGGLMQIAKGHPLGREMTEVAPPSWRAAQRPPPGRGVAKKTPTQGRRLQTGRGAARVAIVWGANVGCVETP